MKKTILLLIIVMATMSINAQVIHVFKNGITTPEATYIDSDTHQYKAVFEQADANLLTGMFSVSATKKVQFTKGNLYWDGSEFKFEANQTDFPTSWDTSHVGCFFWTSLADYQSGNASYMPWAESYSYSSQSTGDKFWCGEDNPLTVEGTSGLYTLTGGKNGEWSYLFYGRTNANKLYKMPVTVTNGETQLTYCVIIAPDDFTGTLKDSYTLDEVNAAGLVCLPPAGVILNKKFYDNGGNYWSATPNSDNSWSAYMLQFSGEMVHYVTFDERSYCQSIRLVHTIK